MDGWSPPARPIHEQVREITDATAPAPATGVRLRGDSAISRYKRTTGPLQMPQFQIPRLAVFAALALAVVGLMAYLYIPGSLKENREADFTASVAAAREDNARAQATSDRGLKRQLLDEAQAKLVVAAKIHKDDADVVSLQADVASALQLLDSVYEVKDFTTVADLAQLVTGSLSVSHAVIGGDQAYVLDAKGKRVLRVPLDGSSAPETIMQEGQLGGFVTAARPVQIAWSEQTQALVMVDENRQAFGYFPASKGTLPLTVRGADGIGSFDAISGTNGNLYVLDLKENQVWRYLPGQGGFDSERTALLDQRGSQQRDGTGRRRGRVRARRQAGHPPLRRQGRDAVPDRRHRYAAGVAGVDRGAAGLEPRSSWRTAATSASSSPSQRRRVPQARSSARRSPTCARSPSTRGRRHVRPQRRHAAAGVADHCPSRDAALSRIHSAA